MHIKLTAADGRSRDGDRTDRESAAGSWSAKALSAK